jgi:hypothetical protein
MVSKSKKENAGKKKKIKVLSLNKETVKDLKDDEAKNVKGGVLISLDIIGAPSKTKVRATSTL